MKILYKEMIHDLVIAFVLSCVGFGGAFWVTTSWEASIVVAVVLFYAFGEGAISTYYALRRNPEYQKDTKEIE